jgi:hypothetical protein
MPKKKGISRIWKVIGKILGRLGLVALGLIGILLVTLLVLFIRYKQWESGNNSELMHIKEQNYTQYKEEGVSVLTEFQQSQIEKESLRLTRDEFEGVILQSLEDNDTGNLEGLDIVTRNRSFDIYVKPQGWPWFIINGWQRQEGSVDLVIYDIKVGPISLSKLSWGWVSGQFSQGVNDSLDLILSGSFAGRKIEEMYIFENGVRFVGVLETDPSAGSGQGELE